MHTSQEQTWNDGVELGLDVYLAAIDELSKGGGVDAEKVGITGYSYSGWLTVTSITRAPDRFAAAVIANADPVTLTGYYSYVDSPLQGLTEDYFVGAAPFGKGLQTWIERVPALSSHEIRAPVLFSATDPWHLIGFWDLYASLRYQGKPVELQYIRTGTHNITKPLHKVAHQELLVDWFDYWLNGHEDPDPRKAEQYSRRRNLRQ